MPEGRRSQRDSSRNQCISDIILVVAAGVDMKRPAFGEVENEGSKARYYIVLVFATVAFCGFTSGISR